MKRRRDTFEADDAAEPAFRSEYRHYRTRKQTKPDVQAIKGTPTTSSPLQPTLSASRRQSALRRREISHLLRAISCPRSCVPVLLQRKRWRRW
jgi:hypothetical protein